MSRRSSRAPPVSYKEVSEDEEEDESEMEPEAEEDEEAMQVEEDEDEDEEEEEEEDEDEDEDEEAEPAPRRGGSGRVRRSTAVAVNYAEPSDGTSSGGSPGGSSSSPSDSSGSSPEGNVRRSSRRAPRKRYEEFEAHEEDDSEDEPVRRKGKGKGKGAKAKSKVPAASRKKSGMAGADGTTPAAEGSGGLMNMFGFGASGATNDPFADLEKSQRKNKRLDRAARAASSAGLQDTDEEEEEDEDKDEECESDASVDAMDLEEEDEEDEEDERLQKRSSSRLRKAGAAKKPLPKAKGRAARTGGKKGKGKGEAKKATRAPSRSSSRGRAPVMSYAEDESEDSEDSAEGSSDGEDFAGRAEGLEDETGSDDDSSGEQVDENEFDEHDAADYVAAAAAVAAIDPKVVAEMKAEGWLFADFPQIETTEQVTAVAQDSDKAADSNGDAGAPDSGKVVDSLANLAVLPSVANPYEGMDLDGTIEGHPNAGIGKRTRRFFRACANPMVDGIIVAYIPQGEAEDDYAMWKNWHQDDGALEDLEQHELDRAVAAHSDGLRKPRGGKAAKYDDDEEEEEVEEPVNLREAFVGDVILELSSVLSDYSATSAEWLQLTKGMDTTLITHGSALKRAVERYELEAKALAETEAKAKREEAERAAKAQHEADVAAVVNAGAGQHADPTAGLGTIGTKEVEEAKPAPKVKKYLVRWRIDANDQASHIHCSWEEVRDLKYCFGNTRLSTALTNYHKRKDRGAYDTKEDDVWEEEDEIGDDNPLKYCLNPKLTQVERVIQIGEDLFGDDEEDDEEEEETESSEGSDAMEVAEDDIFDAKDAAAAKSSNADADADAEGRGPLTKRILSKLNRAPLQHQVLVKWAGLGYDELSWEYWKDLRQLPASYGASDALEAFVELETREVPPGSRRGKPNKNKTKAMIASCIPEVYECGGSLRDYQREGVSWMAYNWHNGRSSLLADEMGLGKTLQTVAYLDQLNSQYHVAGPFLIVAPLSTLQHWRREVEKWTKLNVVVYQGDAKARKNLRDFETSFVNPAITGRKRHTKLQVLITSYEMVTNSDAHHLKKLPWSIIVVDEAHRLKNHESKLATSLKEFDGLEKGICKSLLLTGTPLQNNTTEFWALMNFMDRVQFDDLDEFKHEFGEMTTSAQIDKLHEKMKPYMLRRLKEDVEDSVPPKEETRVKVELTNTQKRYYRALYEKNLNMLNPKGKRAADGPSLMNIAMELRKCCNHPFLLRGVRDDLLNEHETKYPLAYKQQAEQHQRELELLINGSGKLVFLDKMLPKLKSEGHRVLIFSQFKIMLDLLEEFLEGRGFGYERLDGDITGLQRQEAIDRYQSPKSKSLVMLLSTRAGGCGINLVAADTVIIYDSDFNPQNDLQAQARCHRIGQTKMVKIYRLVANKTYEMKMAERASHKLALDKAVLGGGEKAPALSKKEVEELLKKGAYDFFMDQDQDKESQKFCEASIDEILKLNTEEIKEERGGSGGGSDDKGKSPHKSSAFASASYVPGATDESTANDGNDEVDLEDPDFWKNLGLSAPAVVDSDDEFELADGEEGEGMGKWARKKGRNRRASQKINYSEEAAAAAAAAEDAGLDDDSSADAGSDSDSDSSGEDGKGKKKAKKGDDGKPKRHRKTEEEKAAEEKEKEAARLAKAKEWKKTTVDKLSKYINVYGIGPEPVDLSNDAGGVGCKMPDAYSEEQVNEMAHWLVFKTMLVTVLPEATEDHYRKKIDGRTKESKDAKKTAAAEGKDGADAAQGASGSAEDKQGDPAADTSGPAKKKEKDPLVPVVIPEVLDVSDETLGTRIKQQLDDNAACRHVFQFLDKLTSGAESADVSVPTASDANVRAGEGEGEGEASAGAGNATIESADAGSAGASSNSGDVATSSDPTPPTPRMVLSSANAPIVVEPASETKVPPAGGGTNSIAAGTASKDALVTTFKQLRRSMPGLLQAEVKKSFVSTCTVLLKKLHDMFLCRRLALPSDILSLDRMRPVTAGRPFSWWTMKHDRVLVTAVVKFGYPSEKGRHALMEADESLPWGAPLRSPKVTSAPPATPAPASSSSSAEGAAPAAGSSSGSGSGGVGGASGSTATDSPPTDNETAGMYFANKSDTTADESGTRSGTAAVGPMDVDRAKEESEKEKEKAKAPPKTLARMIGATTLAKTVGKPHVFPKKEQLKKRLDALVANATVLDDEDRGVAVPSKLGRSTSGGVGGAGGKSKGTLSFKAKPKAKGSTDGPKPLTLKPLSFKSTSKALKPTKDGKSEKGKGPAGALSSSSAVGVDGKSSDGKDGKTASVPSASIDLTSMETDEAEAAEVRSAEKEKEKKRTAADVEGQEQLPGSSTVASSAKRLKQAKLGGSGGRSGSAASAGTKGNGNGKGNGNDGSGGPGAPGGSSGGGGGGGNSGKSPKGGKGKSPKKSPRKSGGGSSSRYGGSDSLQSLAMSSENDAISVAPINVAVADAAASDAASRPGSSAETPVAVDSDGENSRSPDKPTKSPKRSGDAGADSLKPATDAASTNMKLPLASSTPRAGSGTSGGAAVAAGRTPAPASTKRPLEESDPSKLNATATVKKDGAERDAPSPAKMQKLASSSSATSDTPAASGNKATAAPTGASGSKKEKKSLKLKRKPKGPATGKASIMGFFGPAKKAV